MVNKPCVILAIFFTTWIVSLISIPLLITPATINLGNEGRVGVDDFEFQLNPYANFIYKSGDAACHQWASRSYFINGNQFPFCARCTGIFLGFAIGAWISVFCARIEWYWVLACLAPISIDGTVQLIGWWESFNFLRLITGILAGAITTLALGVICRELFGLVKKKPLPYSVTEKRKASIKEKD